MFDPFVFHIRWPQLDICRTDYSSSAARRDYFKRRLLPNRFVVFSLKNIVIRFVYFLSVGLSETDARKKDVFTEKKEESRNKLFNGIWKTMRTNKKKTIEWSMSTDSAMA